MRNKKYYTVFELVEITPGEAADLCEQAENKDWPEPGKEEQKKIDKILAGKEWRIFTNG